MTLSKTELYWLFFWISKLDRFNIETWKIKRLVDKKLMNVDIFMNNKEQCIKWGNDIYLYVIVKKVYIMLLW